MDGFFADLARVYQEEIAELAAAGCRYLQIDDTNYAYLCDPTLRAQVKSNIGEDPAKLPQVYANLINAAIAERPKDMAVVHPYLPRQQPERLGCRGRLRAGRRIALQRGRRRGLFPRI